MKTGGGVNSDFPDWQSLSPFESRTTTQVALSLILLFISVFVLFWCAFGP